MSTEFHENNPPENNLRPMRVKQVARKRVFQISPLNYEPSDGSDVDAGDEADFVVGGGAFGAENVHVGSDNVIRDGLPFEELAEDEFEQFIEDDLTSSDDDEELIQSRRVLRDNFRREQAERHIIRTANLNPQSSQAAGHVEEPLIPDGMDWYSEYDDSEGSIDTHSENEEYIPGKKSTIPKVSLHTDFKKLVWKVAMKFPSPIDFRNMVVRYAVIAGYSIRWVRNEKVKNERMGKLEAKCKKGCSWKVYASWNGDHSSFVVKSVNAEHTCSREDYENIQARPAWLAREYLPQYKANPNWSAKELAKDVLQRFGVRLETWSCYRVKAFAHSLLHGSITEHYMKLGSYINSIKGADENATVVLETDPPAMEGNPDVFKRLYMGFSCLREGFLNGCRPVIQMLESIRLALMQRQFNKKSAMAKVTDNICPMIRKKLEIKKEKARYGTPIPATPDEFQVLHGMEMVIVNLKERTCGCRKWDLTGIPCCHAIACCNWRRVSCDEYVHPWLKKESYMISYNKGMKGMNGPDWEKVDFPLSPPPIKAAPGRPPKNRRKDPIEVAPGKLSKHGTRMRCTKCGGYNHNQRTCKKRGEAVAGNPQHVAKKRGRPRKDQSNNPEKPQRPRGRPRKGGRLNLHQLGGPATVLSQDSSAPPTQLSQLSQAS